MRNSLIGIALCGTLVLAGCLSTAAPATRPSTASAASDFEHLVRDRGSITFRSWNGQALRMDSDTELTFYADHSIHMFEWGITLFSYQGRYHLHDDGCVVARFKEFDHEWPVMVLYRDGSTFLLRPWDPDLNFVMGNRGGATLPGEKGSYWPFRMLSGKDERDVLEMIEQEAKRHAEEAATRPLN